MENLPFSFFAYWFVVIILTIIVMSWFYLIFKYQRRSYRMLKEMAEVAGVKYGAILKIDDPEEYGIKKRGCYLKDDE